MDYRLFQPDDFSALYAIEEACFEGPLRFSGRYMRGLVNSPEAATWLAEEEGRLAGFGIVEWARTEGGTTGYIQTLEVAPGFRRRGIGRELLKRLESAARDAGAAEIWLHVDEQNAAALRLYRENGYERQGRHEHYYGRARAAEIYRKLLTGKTESAAASG